jgi:hypothetical protein
MGAAVSVTVSEIVFGGLLVVALVVLSLVVGWRQIITLRRLGASADTPDEERLYERRKAIRRIISSALTLVLAVLLGYLVASFDSTAGQALRERQQNADPAAGATDQQKYLIRLWGVPAIATLLVLLVVLVLAGLDLWATRRFARSQYSKIAGDRRAMIQRQVNRLRQERNGEGFG